MKTFIFLLCTTVFSLTTETTFSQEKVMIKKDQLISVDQVFKIIKKQTDYRFIYPKKLFKNTPKVQLKKGTIALDKLLNQSLSNNNLHFELTLDNVIIIKEKSLDIVVFQQQITGTVTDSDGLPLAGAHILEKGTTNGAQADFDGKFSITTTSENAILIISYLGYIKKEITANRQTNISVILEEDATGLDEVVVVAFGTQKKSNLTTAVATISAAEIQQRPLRSLGDGLQGLVAGLNINAPSGAPEAGVNLNIRGFTGIGQQGSPLVLVDGVERNIADINPNDVENISVLKDAASTAIYGSRAPYGIVLITTKGGKKNQKVQINFSTNTRIVTNPNQPTPNDSWDHMTFTNNAFINDNRPGTFYPQLNIDRARAFGAGDFNNPVFDGLNPDHVPFGTFALSDTQWAAWGNGFANTNWFDEGLKKSVFSQQHDLSVSGGSETSSFYMGLGFNETNGIFKGIDDFKDRYSILGRYSADVTDWMEVKLSTNYVRTEEEGPNVLGQGRNYRTIWNVIARSYPWFPTHNPNGSIYRFNTTANTLGPGGSEGVKRNDITLSGEAVIKPLKGWKITGQYTWRANTNDFSRITLPVYQILPNGQEVRTQRSAPRTSLIKRTQNTAYSTVNLFSSYERTVAEKHSFNVLAGYQQEENNLSQIQVNSSNFLSPAIPTIGTSGDIDNATDRLLDWATRGYFGRFSYNYDQKYFLEFNGRYDATSRFRADKRWGFFPSVSGAWNIARENFWPAKDLISSFKIRGSWATSGNANINALGGDNNFYLFSPTIPVNQIGNIALGGSTITQAGLPALIPETLTWEKPTSIGIGLDVLAFNNRLEVNYDWYQRTTKDQSGPPNPLPTVLGTAPPATNNSESETRGWEVSVKWQDQSFNVLGKPFKYSISARMNDYIGYVTKYEHNGTGAIGGQWTPGEVFGQNRLYSSNGIIQNGAQLNTIVPHTGAWIYPGDLSIQDINGDGVINQGNGGVWNSLGDRPLTDSYNYPRFRYGFSLAAEWNGFDISMNLDGVGHWKTFSGNQYIWGQGGSQWFAPFFKETTDLGYWTANNTGAFLPRNAYSGKNRLPTDQYLLNLAHLRIRNIKIGYNIPSDIVQKMGLRSLNIYASGENLGFIYYKSFIKLDPQLLASSSGEGYPPSRTFSLGLNIGL